MLACRSESWVDRRPVRRQRQPLTHLGDFVRDAGPATAGYRQLSEQSVGTELLVSVHSIVVEVVACEVAADDALCCCTLCLCATTPPTNSPSS